MLRIGRVEMRRVVLAADIHADRDSEELANGRHGAIMGDGRWKDKRPVL